MMTEPTDLKTLEARCFCGSVHFTVDVPKSVLPFRAHLCHCSLCRFSLGMPCVFHVHFPKDVVPKFVGPSSEANMTAYTFGNDASWNFCSTCGCHIASIGFKRGNWVPSTSIFTDHCPENFQIGTHIYTKSVIDGGIADILTRVGERELEIYNPPEDSDWAKVVVSEPEVGQDGKDRMRAQCHCGGVSFTFPRPTEELLKDDYMSKYVSHKDSTKWHACFDACDDCRLNNGAHVVGWTFIPLSLCEPPIKPDLLIGTSKTYRSSPDVLRSFCGKCGATFFYAVDERRPTDRQQIVDLAVGVMRAPEGLMAENWLTWRARVGYLDSGKKFDREFAEALQEGMNKFVLEKEGSIEDYPIG